VEGRATPLEQVINDALKVRGEADKQELEQRRGLLEAGQIENREESRSASSAIARDALER
jgi:hypothetical protein